MITIDMVLKYIKEHKRNPHNEALPVCLTNPQIKFLENLCAGKITSTPRLFGTTWLIKMYCDCLDYYHYIERYDDSVQADETISLKETMEGWQYYGVNMYNNSRHIEAYEENPEKFCNEYNATAEDIEWIKKWIEWHGDLKDS
jgi:hypothetical protein